MLFPTIHRMTYPNRSNHEPTFFITACLSDYARAEAKQLVASRGRFATKALHPIRLAVRFGAGRRRGVCALALPPVHELLRQARARLRGAGVRRARLALEARAAADDRHRGAVAVGYRDLSRRPVARR